MRFISESELSSVVVVLSRAMDGLSTPVTSACSTNTNIQQGQENEEEKKEHSDDSDQSFREVTRYVCFRGSAQIFGV